MKTLNLKMPVGTPALKKAEPYLVGLILLLLWYTAPLLFELPAGNAIEITQSVSLMVLLALISFLLVLALCWYLLYRFWVLTGLPAMGEMVLQFKELRLWEQLKFVLALFALLLLAGIGALIAVL